MNQYKIPKNLQNPEFRFAKLREKRPFEKAWQKNGYKFNDKELIKHLDSKQNCGVIGGYGRLRIQDIDDKELADKLIEKLNTFSVRTGSGGCHIYFRSDLNTNFVLKNDMGEFRANNYQCVAPNMKHPNGNFYKVEKDLPIREIEPKEFLEIMKPYLRDKELKEHFGHKTKHTLNCSTGKLETSGSDESRSADEYRKVISLIRRGKNKEEVFRKMNVFAKWSSAHEAYRELTYNKARDYVEGIQLEQEEQDKISVMDFKTLMNFKVEPIKWLIKDQIPCGEVGVLAGKRGEGKTWIALKQALGICSKREVFGDEVPEKKRVMIIDEESGEGILAKRLQLLSEAEGIKKEELELISISFAGLKLDQIDSKKHHEFKQIVDEFKPNLIIVDCLQRVCSFDIDKENALISSLFTGTVRPMIKAYGMSWLFIHHLRKSPTGNQNSSGDPLDEVRGGSELVNYCRYVLGCSTPKNQKNEDGSLMFVLKVLKMSNSNIAEGKVINFQPKTPDPDTNTEIRMDYFGKPEDVLRTEVRVANAIKDFLFEEGISGEFTTKQITDAEKKIGFKKTFLSKGLKELVDDGFLEKVKRGVYRIIGEVKTSSKPSVKPKLPYGSPKKTIEEQKKDLVKTEDDINDEEIEESLRLKKIEETKNNSFCPKCNAPIVENKCIGGCE